MGLTEKKKIYFYLQNNNNGSSTAKELLPGEVPRLQGMPTRM